MPDDAPMAPPCMELARDAAVQLYEGLLDEGKKPFCHAIFLRAKNWPIINTGIWDLCWQLDFKFIKGGAIPVLLSHGDHLTSQLVRTWRKLAQGQGPLLWSLQPEPFISLTPLQATGNTRRHARPSLNL